MLASSAFAVCRDARTALLRAAINYVTCNAMRGGLMAVPGADRVQKRRQALRAAGLRPLQIWVPDMRKPGFAEECRRQAGLVAEADRADQELQGFMEAAWSDLDSLGE
jgi:hypothetical protein